MAAYLESTDITEFNPSGDISSVYSRIWWVLPKRLFGDGYSQVDLTGGVDVSEDFYLGNNATLADAGDEVGFSGVALYAQLAASDEFKIGARFELFQDDAVVFADFADTNASDSH
ncbi:hypothetical protein D5R40_32150 [Okeania hirsuta]|uniref:Porin n=1 Tax=Okeania hirsuta TaxID=1458930 RepID=A0A3N6PV70_9CYAN|nr:outer membrane beta-barrel protein [Okeania hirsuta]RQH20298.1 hypothetical protein D5R40_32150 [Okeania hirsuta]